MHNYYVIGALLAFIVSALAGCPQYLSIAQPAAFSFDPTVYQGVWYQVATNEPTMPCALYNLCSLITLQLTEGSTLAHCTPAAFCQCATLNWTLSDVGTFTDVFSARCGPKNISFALAGRLSKNASEPGSLMEGFNQFLAVPNMIFNLTMADTGRQYQFASVYSCLGLGLYSFQLLSRIAVVPEAIVRGFIDAAAHLGLDMKNVKIFDFTACGF